MKAAHVLGVAVAVYYSTFSLFQAICSALGQTYSVPGSTGTWVFTRSLCWACVQQQGYTSSCAVVLQKQQDISGFMPSGWPSQGSLYYRRPKSGISMYYLQEVYAYLALELRLVDQDHG